MQGPSTERRIAKTGSNGSAELRTITMTADFRTRLRRSVTLSINRGEIKIIRQQADSIFKIAQARVAQAWSNRDMRFWFPRLTRSARESTHDFFVTNVFRAIVEDAGQLRVRNSRQCAVATHSRSCSLREGACRRAIKRPALGRGAGERFEQLRATKACDLW
jgi:hypothetical protein